MTKKEPMETPHNHGTIIEHEASDLMRDKYSAFAASSNARAIPDMRDGLKPVHRRVLYTAKQDAPSSRQTVKSATIVGSCLGKYHPHGDVSVYDAMSRMTRDFVATMPLVFGHGNHGAIDGSSAAAQRYTEAKLDPQADWVVMDGVDEGAVPHAPNYDGRLTEPELLPVKIPLLILNGVAAGTIGVGFASQIPPHNANELAAACILVLDAMINGEEPSLMEIMRVMPGPDFPTGGFVSSPTEIAQMYATGRGSMRVRSKIDIEGDAKTRGGATIVISEIPFGLTTSNLVEAISDAANGKRDKTGKGRLEPSIPEIRSARDETTVDRRTKRVNVRIVIELKQGEDPNVVAEKLVRNTDVETTFAANMIALDPNGLPVIVTLVEAITSWANFRAECIGRQAGARLSKQSDRLHVIKGLLLAIPMITKVVTLIKDAADEPSALQGLRTLIGCTTKQAEAILAMQLRRLTGLRKAELDNEQTELEADIEYQLTLMTDQAAVITKMKDELKEVARRVGKPRKTEVCYLGDALNARDLVVEEDCLVSITGRGYLRRLPADEFRIQNRATKGRRGAKVKDDDMLLSVVGCNSHDRMFAITNAGYAVKLEAHEIPITNGNGRHAANLGFEEGELVKEVVVTSYPVPELSQVVVATMDGDVKRTMLSELDGTRGKRLRFFATAADRHIAGAIQLPNGEGDVFLASAHGFGIRMTPDDIRLTQRNAGGIRGMALREDDCVISIGRIDSAEQLILCITNDGIGKRVASDQFPNQIRGGKGRILIKPRPGTILLKALVVTDSDTVLIATKNGHTVRIRVGDIRELGRSAMGSRLITLNDGDEVVSAAVLPLTNDVEEIVED